MRLLPFVALGLVACTPKPSESSPPADDSGTDACPVMVVDPESLSWTDLVLGTPATANVSILNNCVGTQALSIQAAVEGEGFSVDQALASAEPGALVTLGVTVTLTAQPGATGSLTLVTNDSRDPLLTIPLDARADPDQDGDGTAWEEDCDDTDAGVSPTAAEVWYDGVDQDCDGNDDDQDGDGVAVESDCDDTDPGVYPGAPEVWYDGVDQDCLGDDFDQDGDGVQVDTDCDDTDAAVFPGAAEVWYDGVDQDCVGDDDFDRDADGFALAEDCDDTDLTVNPAADEVWYDGVDQDCDGNDDDQDGDGWTEGVDDCDDTDATVNPGAVEVWYDGLDQDCAGDDDQDQDHDGYPLGTDCDDTDGTVNPGATEVWYDGLDQDCAGDDDQDQDHDGVQVDLDCDDTDAGVNPSAAEVWYDGVDQDCDGRDDDQDADGWDRADDCLDTDASVNPGEAEVWYDGVDQDCDGNDADQDGDGVDAFVTGGLDCDDTDAATTDGHAETDNGLDDDCDGVVDEGFAVAGDIWITEVMADPAAVSDTAGEWFELYNPGSSTVDLSGWVVYSDDGGSFTVSGSLPVEPGGYVVFGVNADAGSNGGFTPDYVYNRTSFGLSNADSIYLVAGAVTVAELAFDATWPVTTGASLGLDLAGGDARTDAASWCAAVSAYGDGDLGTPGAENDPCAAFDHDGDGESVSDGDCDDTDPDAWSGGTEVDDGVDQDCDGVVDEILTDIATAPYLTASYYGSGMADGDLTGDGVVDLVLWPSDRYVYVVDGSDWRTWAGGVSTWSDAVVDVGLYWYLSGPVSLGDQTGDGRNDLLLGTASASTASTTCWYVYDAPSGSLAPGDADLTGSCTVRPTGTAPRVAGDTDFNGDGVDEVIVGNYNANTWFSGGGRIDVYDVAGLSGSVPSTAVAWTIRPTGASQNLGLSFDTGDFDGDGYPDLGLWADGADVYLLPSNGMPAGVSDTFSTLATIHIDDSDAAADTMVMADYDGDGAADLASYANRVYTGLAGRSGTLNTTDATVDYTSTSYVEWSCYRAEPVVDLDGNGAMDLTVSCAGVTESGTLFLDVPSLGATADEGDGFYGVEYPGHDQAELASVQDLDGDGTSEWIVNDFSGSAGYTYVLTP